MKRRACSRALAVAIGLLALSLLGGIADGDSGGSSGAPKSLTHHFPLGTQTLSHTKTARGAATTPSRASATTPRKGSTATAHRPRSTQAARHHDAHGTSSALFLLVIPALIVVALLGRVLVRMSRRTGPREPAGSHAPAPDRARERVSPADQATRPNPANPAARAFKRADPDADAGVIRLPARVTGSTGGARWSYVDKEEVEPPSLPVRRRAKGDQTPRVS